MEKVYKDALESLSKAAEKSAADSKRVKELAIRAGAEEKDLTLHNALLACERVIGEYLDLRQEAEKLGTSLPNALKSYRMVSKRDKALVPDILTTVPPHWILRENLSVGEARKISKALQADLKALYKNLAEAYWMTDEEKEEYSTSVIECFQEESSEEFRLSVIKATWNLKTDKHPQGKLKNWDEIETQIEEEEAAAEEEAKEPVIASETEEFNKCLRWSDLYSVSIRDSLENWARDNQIRIHRESLANWADGQFSHLHSYLMRERLGKDWNIHPVNDLVTLALRESGLIDQRTGLWVDEVPLSLVEGMVNKYREMSKREGEPANQTELLNALCEMAKKFISNCPCLTPAIL